MRRKGFLNSREWAATFIVGLTVILLVVSSASSQKLVWEEIKGPYGGKVHALLATPDGTLYAGTSDSGVFRSDDRGNNWIEVNAGLKNKSILSFAVMGTTLFVGTFGGGIFRSDDRGNNWTEVNTGLKNLRVESLVVMGTILFAGTNGGGVFRSDDRGNNWIEINTGLKNLNIFSFAVMDMTLFAGTFDGGVFRSDDRGNNWIEINTGLKNLNIFSFAVMGTTLFAGTLAGVFRSDDRGNNWIEVNAGLKNKGILSFAVMGTTLFAGSNSGEIFHSKDRGNTWIRTGLMSFKVRSFAVTGMTLYAGTNGGGVFRSNDGGDNWINIGLKNLEVASFTVMGTTLFVKASDDRLFRSDDRGTTWIEITSELKNLGVVSLVVVGTTLFMNTSDYYRVFRSEDRGNTWIEVKAGLTKLRVESFAVMGTTLFAGTSAGVFRSDDRGNNWNETGLTRSISSLAIMGTTLYASAWGGGVFRSDDRGNTWIEVKTDKTDSWMSSVEMVVMGTTLFYADVYEFLRSDDKGNSWDKIEWPDDDVVSFAVMGTTLFIGRSGIGGVFRSEDGGYNWHDVSPTWSPTVKSLVIMDATLYVNTDRGFFRASLSSSPVLSIIAPTPNQVFPVGTASTTLTVKIENHTGHWHVHNKPFPTSGPAGGNIVITSGNSTTITGLVDGQTYTLYATLVDANHNVLNPPVTASVTFSVASPLVTFTLISPVIADGISASIINITIKDSTGKPVSNRIIAISATGSDNIIVQPSSPTDQNGMTTAMLKSIRAETKIVSITVDGNPMDTTAKVEFLPNTVSSANSTVIASGSASANGTSQLKLTTTLLNANKNPIKGKRAIVSATGTGNIITQPTTPTDENGVTTASISSTKAEDKIITVSVDDIKLNPITITFTQTPLPPKIESISPNSGKQSGGTSITITGSNFISGATVTIGGNAASNVIVSPPSTIIAITPQGQSEAKDVVVINPDGQQAVLTGGFRYLLPPSIKSITPNKGAIDQKTAVGIEGTNFTSKTQVTIGGIAAEEIKVASENLITAIFPPQSVGAKDVMVINPDGQSTTLTGGFTYEISGKMLETLMAMFKTESFITLNVSPEKKRLNDKATISGELLPTQISVPSEGLPISISYTSPTGKITTLTVKTNSQRKYQATIELMEVGKYIVQAQWPGDDKYKSSQQSLEFEVEKGVSKLTWTNPLSIDARYGEKISLIGQLSPKLKSQDIRVQIIRPDGVISKVEKSSTDEFSSFQIEIRMELPGVWKAMAIWDGNDNYQSTQSEQITITVKKETKAIVVLGGGDETENPAWNTFAGLANYVYQSLKRRTLTDDDIYYLSPTLKKLETIDDLTTEGRLEFAITNWAAKRVGVNTPLLIYLLSHNLDDKFILEKQGSKEAILTPDKLDLWLKHLPEGTPVIIIIEACYSGTFIEKKRAGKPVLPKPDRIVITSAKSNRQSYILPNRSSFSKEFFDNVQRNKDIRKAFLETRDLLKGLSYHRGQFPQMDANGDGVANDPIRDFPTVEGYYIPDNIEALPAVPEILEISQPQQLKSGEKSATIQVKVRGVNITKVFGNVTPPNFNPESEFKSWEELAFDEISFQKKSEGLYEGSHEKFTLPGTYSVVVYAENPDGSATPIETKVTVTSPPWDANSDGEVNIFDVVIVAKNVGLVTKEGDVNGDGKVNIFDLVLVINHFGEKLTSASPSIETAEIDVSQYLSILEKAYQLLQASSNSSPEFETARRLLKHLISLAAPVVKETKLLPNYPNPFNPETWIPYQLSKSSDIEIRIYDVLGNLVRRLRIGHKEVGIYITKEQAVYWDGRNEIGEKVASGVYFYQLQAGSFSVSDMRKMLMVK